jgi:hypothetical protein
MLNEYKERNSIYLNFNFIPLNYSLLKNKIKIKD